MRGGGGSANPRPAPPSGRAGVEPDARPHPLDVLIPGLAERAPAAYDQLYNLMADRLFAFAFRMLGDRHEAEDAVQQAFLELTRTASPPRRGRSLEAWLFTSVRFTCGDLTRQRARRPMVPVDPVPEGDHEDHYDLGLEPALESALGNLTGQQRMVIHLKHVEGVDGEQIAQILGLSRMAVYATAARGERRLRQLLAGAANAHPLVPFQRAHHG